MVPENIPNAPMAVGEVGSGPPLGSGILDNVMEYVGDFFGKRWVKKEDKKIVDEIKKAETPAKPEKAMKDAGPLTISSREMEEEKAFMNELKNRQNWQRGVRDVENLLIQMEDN